MAPKPAAAGRRFDIFEIDVQGNSLLSEVAIQTAMEPFLGPDKQAEDVEAARASLETLYRSLGYKTVVVSIPRQSVAEGTVQLEVVEGAIKHLNIIGDKYTSRDALRAETPALRDGSVPNFQDLQEQLTYANRFPNRRVTPSLHAGSAPGEVDIDLNVEEQFPLHASLEVNNRHSQGTTFDRVVGNVSYDNLFQRGHSLSLTYQIAPQRPSDGRVYYGSYLARLGDGSWNLLATALKTGSDISAFSGVDVKGKGRSYGLRLIKQLPDLEGTIYPSVSLGIENKHFLTVTELGVGGSLPTPLAEYPVSLSYSQTVRLAPGNLQTDLSLVFPLPHSGSDTSTYQVNRAFARRDWYCLRASNSLSWNFGSYVQAAVRLGGQITDQPLVSIEQYGAGGADSVRGYLEAEAQGDYGFAGGVELRGPSIPDLFPSAAWTQRLTEFRFYLFTDGARVQLRGPFPDAETRTSSTLWSAGGGLTFRLIDHLNGVVEWADPLESGPATRIGHSRIIFRAVASF